MRRGAKEPPRARNQRVSNPKVRRQQHLLDVKVRSHKAVQHRNKRILVLTSKVVLGLLTVAAIVYGARHGARRLFFDNPDYRLAKIEVRTDGMLQRDVVLQTAGLREGVNIFNVNLAHVHNALEQLPQVDEVQVVRHMPDTIDVTIVERKPVAWITTEKEFGNPFASEDAFLVDARGVLMREKKLLPEYLGLPVIAGCANESLEPGKVVDSFEAKAALELLKLSTRSFMQTRFQIREINVSKGYCLEVTDKNHTRVIFGFDDLDAQLLRLEQFLVWADDAKREIETLNLMVQRNIPVTFAKTAAEIINETIGIDGAEPKILKATPVNPGTKTDVAPGASKPKSGSDKARKATPVERARKG